MLVSLMPNILVLADTHGRIPRIPKAILSSPVDIIGFAGDLAPNFDKNWSLRGDEDWRRVCNVEAEAVDQNQWMKEKLLPWAHKNFPQAKKVILQGNHDWFDISDVQGIEYLRTGSKVVTVEGLKIGLLGGVMPISGEWFDEISDFEMNQRILAMDKDIDILISHCCPLGVRDKLAYNHQRVGSKSLRDAIFGVGSAFDDSVSVPPHFNKLSHHFMGHIHEMYGSEEHIIDGRKVGFHNAAEHYSYITI